MSAVDRTLRNEPPAPLSSLGRVAVAALEHVLPNLEGGRLDVRLPDGSERSFGAGNSVRIEIDDGRFFRRLATRGKLALGESYTAGEWRTDDLVGLFELLLRNAEVAGARHPRLSRTLELRPSLRARNGVRGARRNIGYHYDLGNELFELFLDATMTYSCAIFERGGEPLADAQRRKLRRICDQLRLGPDDHVLEIGCGWGSFALLAAGEYGARVTGLTISAEQASLGRRRVADAGLAGRVEIREQDYRTIDGTFTKVASIEMLEAIGERQFTTYFRTIDRVLAPDGIACVQTILVPDRRWRRYRKSPDWIERYVFPGCLIPSLGALNRSMASASRLEVYGLDEIGIHYAETLRRWRTRFHKGIEEVRRLGYDERFERTWDFYLAFCEAAFRTRVLRDVQLTLTRPGGDSPR
jgi:cyclopropane-fatty-acyl-phospholipid synthase